MGLWLALLLMMTGANGDAPGDADRDGLADATEQRLLERFRPAMHYSRTDCDALPSEFAPGLKAPKVVARNGTMYGQVFPVKPAGREGSYVEVHYFHLWKRDCGRLGHELDAEQVSVLLKAEKAGAGPEEWKAVFWYAGAHEGTVCDASNGARAASLNAEDRGPHVWVSHGKHASYLGLDLCRKIGCGGDRCQDMVEGPAGALINLGEWGAPLNGATWVRGGNWKMAGKFQSDFTAVTLERLERLPVAAAGTVSGAAAPGKAAMLAGNETLEALETGGRHTGSALKTADRETGEALGTATEKTGAAIGKGASATGKAIRKVVKVVGGK